MISKRYPCGKKKAFNVTYDDGVTQDVRFVSLLNRYGLKGTFNLNSGMAENEFQWTHECGLVVKRLKTEALAPLYAGHEVASHTLSHPYMDSLSREEIMYQLSRDKANLERIFGREIKGFAVPFYYYSKLIESCVRDCGFRYARISEESRSFLPQKDYFNWKATVFHCDDSFEGLLQQFLETDEELAFFQLLGHSYDLDVENKWDLMEHIFRLISSREEILPMTTIELIDYLKAMDQAQITDRYIQNHSDMSLWFAIDDAVHEVKPGALFTIC